MVKICFFGMGSIGKRHLNNLIKILNKRKIEFEIDVVKRKKELDDEVKNHINNIYKINEFEPNFYDIVFIVNDTSAHIETLNLMKNYSNNFFIEKPLSINARKININDYKDKKIYIACPMRYSNVIEYLKKEIDFSKVYSVRAICSTYLPDWRPTIDYRNNYSAKKELGGGVTLDLIHEWDYLTYLLGYFGRIPIRKVEFFLKEGTVIGDFIKNTITLEDNREINLSDDVDDYIKEMNNFLDIIFNQKNNFNNLEHAYKVLKLIKGE